ncbi:MAG: hypothetical protein B7Z69_07730 [Actinobacteria bacterium 21-73-9]|nr:MAG: hypothetical protein B7Z69_07730 [Actinobacteria bacterium 21-73-9]
MWNNTIQLIRRLLAAEGGIGQPNLVHVAQLHYLKVAEVQRRGLAHFHCVLRLDGPVSIDAEPPPWASVELLERVVRSSIDRAWAPDIDGQTVKWGRVHDVQDLGQREEEAVKVAAYVAKYSSKTTDGSKELARRFRSRRQIVALVEDPHLRRLALTAWEDEGRTEPPRLVSGSFYLLGGPDADVELTRFARAYLAVFGNAISAKRRVLGNVLPRSTRAPTTGAPVELSLLVIGGAGDRWAGVQAVWPTLSDKPTNW